MALLVFTFLVVWKGLGWEVPPLARTPFDRGEAGVRAFRLFQGFELLRAAETVIPPSVRVVARFEPPDPAADTELHRCAIALLPGRDVVPAAIWGLPTPHLAVKAEYEIVMGRVPPVPPGELVLTHWEGTVWRRWPRRDRPPRRPALVPIEPSKEND